jgi:deoxyribonuclease-4
LDTFHKIINHSALKDKPMVLETPNELPGYQREIALLRSMEV